MPLYLEIGVDGDFDFDTDGDFDALECCGFSRSPFFPHRTIRARDEFAGQCLLCIGGFPSPNQTTSGGVGFIEFET